MSDNPYQSPKQTSPLSPDEKQPPSSSKAAYNILSDTLIGVNARKSDNKFQALFALASVFVLSLGGILLSWLMPRWQMPWQAGALSGAFLGLVAGILLSGIFLMLYRAARHLRGKHD